jgi:hypothetical protein
VLNWRFRLFVKKHSLTRREATRLISESLERKLPFWKRLLLRAHLFACQGCVRFGQQLRFISDVICKYDPSKAPEPLSNTSLSPAARRRISEFPKNG